MIPGVCAYLWTLSGKSICLCFTAASWVISPLLSGIVSILVFLVVKFLVLRKVSFMMKIKYCSRFDIAHGLLCEKPAFPVQVASGEGQESNLANYRKIPSLRK